MEKKTKVNMNSGADWFNLAKVGLAGLLFVGFMGLGYLAYINPELNDNQQGVILQVIGTLGPVVAVIAYNMWPKGNDTDKATISALADKVPPFTGEAKESADEQLSKDTQQSSAEEQAAQGGPITYRIPD